MRHGIAIYLVIFAILMVLLAATVVAAQMELGAWHATVALAISLVKTVLIVLYFMHVREEPGIVRIFSAAGFCWLVILLVITLGDYAARPDVVPAGREVISARP